MTRHALFFTVAILLIPVITMAQASEPDFLTRSSDRAVSMGNSTSIRGVPPGLFDDFEAYSPDQSLVGQSGWFNLVDTGDTVVTDGIDGQSGAHISDGSESSGQVLGLEVVEGDFGTLSLDVEISSGESSFTIFPGSEANLLNTGIAFRDNSSVVVFQDTKPGDGLVEGVDTKVGWGIDSPMRVDFDINEFGQIMVRIDGRLIFAGEDTAKVNNGGVPSPVDFIGVRASNSLSGDRIMIDNISDVRTIASDDVGEADLYHVIGMGELELFDSVADYAEIYVGQTFMVSTITLNTSDSETADDINVTVQIPPQLSLLSDSCNGTVASGQYISEIFSLAAQGNRVCNLEFQLISAFSEDFVTLVSASGSDTTTDPFLGNNEADFFVFEDPGILFHDRFESP